MPKPSPPALGGPARLLLVGFLFHATYLASIFDIYFVSPVVRVGQRFSPLDSVPGEPPTARAGVKPLASRVVLIIGDGLRADKLYSTFPDPPFDPPLPVHVLPGLEPIQTPIRNKTASGRMTPAPYIRSLIETGQASWGLSHTRVPTESRPGHVAIIAGMYEDVSAVTRGWKMNPVNFDSLFNQSSHSFTFGSPDILPMFKHGASDPSRVDAWSYDAEAEDFTKDAAQLDIWVYDRLKSLLSEAERAGPGSALDAQLRSDQVFFFLHLLGLDTTGHSYRPHSPEYLRNVQVVDQVVQGAQKLIDDFYADNRTAYIFTADHGMSNIGNHGDGDPDNTRTPIVAWGSGVQKASDSGSFALDKSSQSDPYYQNWYLNMSQRKDVEQADLTGLMAALAGIRVPSNSVGRLPLEYLDAPSSELARATYANTRGILQQYETKHDLKASRTYGFRPFPDLPTKETLSKPTILERLFYIQRLILSGRDGDAIKSCAELQELAIRGLRYLQRYDWLRLRVIVVCGYVGWMVYCALFIIRTYILPSLPASRTEDLKFGSIIGAAAFLALALWFYLERAPFTYYLYALFPAYFWAQIIDELDSFQDVLEWASRGGLGRTRPWTTVVVSLVSLECMVVGYFHRIAWTLGWVVIGVLWPMLGMSREFRRENRALVRAWGFSAVASGVFTVLPVEKGESLPVIALGGVGFLITGWVARRMGYRKPSRGQLGVIGVTLLVTLHSAGQLQQKKGLPLANQVIGWLILAGSSAAPLLNRSRNPSSHGALTSRLLEIIFAYAPVFVLLSISYEALFYLGFSVALLVWLELETRLARFGGAGRGQTSRRAGPRFEVAETRLSLFFLFFIHVGFFGTGNVGSLSSFYLEPVYRLVPIFNPFLMSTLLIIKILVPFLIVSSILTGLSIQIGLPKFSLLITSLMVSDVLTLNFFFLVNDQGSWLEIGKSISHFAIDSLLLVFMIVLQICGEGLVCGKSGLSDSGGGGVGVDGEEVKVE